MYITWPSSVLSPDHLTYYYLARPSGYDLTYPDYYQSLDITLPPDYYLSFIMFGCLLNITTCHAIISHPAWYIRHVIISFTGILTCYLFHDQWPVFLLYMQWPDYIVLMCSWFLIMSISCFSRKVMIKLLTLKSTNLYWVGGNMRISICVRVYSGIRLCTLYPV